MWAHLPKQFKGRPEAGGWTHHPIASTQKCLLKLHGYQKLILYHQDLVSRAHSDGELRRDALS